MNDPMDRGPRWGWLGFALGLLVLLGVAGATITAVGGRGWRDPSAPQKIRDLEERLRRLEAANPPDPKEVERRVEEAKRATEEAKRLSPGGPR